ncbi:MAG: hypothetical protein ACREIP_05965, partial [Alphaproteobacteria bacterium]
MDANGVFDQHGRFNPIGFRSCRGPPRTRLKQDSPMALFLDAHHIARLHALSHVGIADYVD